MTCLVEPEERRIQQLLSVEQLGDDRSAQFIIHLQKLFGDKAASLDTAIFRELFMQMLPNSVPTGVATVCDQPLPQPAELADRLLEVSASTVNVTRTDISPDDIADLCSVMNLLTTEVADLPRENHRRCPSPHPTSVRQYRHSARRDFRPTRTSTTLPSSPSTVSRPCFFHCPFRAAAGKCQHLCSWHSKKAWPVAKCSRRHLPLSQPPIPH